MEGEGYDNKLSLTRDQFCEALSLLLKKGTREEVRYTLLIFAVTILKPQVLSLLVAKPS